jgi:hypothetical protein
VDRPAHGLARRAAAARVGRRRARDDDRHGGRCLDGLGTATRRVHGRQARLHHHVRRAHQRPAEDAARGEAREQRDEERRRGGGKGRAPARRRRRVADGHHRDALAGRAVDRAAQAPIGGAK